MSTKNDRSTPVPTKHQEEKDRVNQSTETRKGNSGSKLWIVIIAVVILLLIILSITGVVNL